MDSFNDHPGTQIPTNGPALRSVPKRQYLRGWSGNTKVTPARRPGFVEAPAGGQAVERSAAPLRIQRLEAGQSVKLRTKKLSVLRIAHGNVWATLGIGPHGGVLAGDHFLSPGESLTLLPGQELVMEPFALADGAPAQLTWDEPGAEAAAVHVPGAPVLRPAALWRASVVEPLLDLRHAAGLAARATGRLVVGLGRLAAAALVLPGAAVAMLFIAASAGKAGAASSFDAENHAATAPCRSS